MPGSSPGMTTEKSADALRLAFCVEHRRTHGLRRALAGPVAPGDDRYLVFAGAFERPVVVGGDVLDCCERIIPGKDNAFEEGHAGSTLLCEFRYDDGLRTQRANTR